MKRGSLLIGPLPKGGVAGATLGFQTLLGGFKAAGLEFAWVDLTPGGRPKCPGRFGSSRALASMGVVLAIWRKLPGYGNVYMTIASSRLGFLRDALVIWAARLLRRRIVLHLKGGGYGVFYTAQPPLFQRLIRATLSQADAIVVLGQLLRSQFDFVPEAEQKLRVVPNGLPDGLAANAIGPKTLPVGVPVRLLYLSNMIESKGYRDVLEACRLLTMDVGIQVHCDFCGDFVRTSVDDGAVNPGAAQQVFEQAIHDGGLKDVVTYHGVVTGEQKQQILERASIFLLPTYYPWEGQPISIIEALALGIPVVSTKFRGIPEQVIDGYNGILVPPCSPAAIAQAVQHLASDQTLYQRFSANALHQFWEHFTQDTHLRRLMAIIQGAESEIVEVKEDHGSRLIAPDGTLEPQTTTRRT